MSRVKKALLFTLAVLPLAVVGVYFATVYSISSMDPALLEDAIRQVGSREAVFLLSTIQPVALALLCAFFGYILSDKLGLMRPFRFEKSLLLRVLVISVLCGGILSLDAWTFARWIPELTGYYDSAGSFDAATWIASILYGGVIEEVMMRLFFMSLLALLGWKIFFRRSETVPTGILMAANFISALLFAAGHLPSTAAMFGTLTPLLLLRCFLLNGAAGLVFGWFYRKYGIQYAMLSHALLHIVSRTIWLIALP